MAERGLASGIPPGPFEGTPIYVYAGNGKNARLHARDSCSSLRTPAPRYFALALDSAVLSRMCRSCARWEQWGRSGTAVGIFLRTLTGLIDELDRYTAEDLEEDMNGRDVAKAAGLLARGDWPDEEDDEEAWDEYREARSLRDDLLLPFWRGAADSIHAAFGVISRYPWLRDWAEPRLAGKASYAEELRRQLGQFINPHALLDAAAAYFLPSSELPVNDPGFAAFGDPGRIRMVLQQTWTQWQQDSADSWLPPGAKDWRVHSALDSALGRKRKGRDEARQALSNLYQMWAEGARRIADRQEPSRLVAALIPETRRSEDTYGSDDTGFDRILAQWQLGVIAVHTIAADWEHRAVLLNVPGLIGRRLLEEASDLRCADITHTAAAGGEPAELLAAWVREHLPASEGALLPGVLDDVPIYERRAVSTADAEALMAGRDIRAQPYLVFSASHGMEVLSASMLVTRCESGWRGIIVAGANDLPAWMIEPWAERIATAPRLAASAPDTYHDVAEPQSPEGAIFGEELGIQAGEQALADWHAIPRKHARDIESDLCILAIARTATDLRTLSDRDLSRPQPVTPAVWHALLAYRQLDLSPFRRDDDEHALRQGALGVPLAVLAPVQIYTTNGDPGYEKGHGPHCQHARGSAMALHRGYDLITAADLLRRSDYSWCSKCGGYAIRRLNEIQLAYYRAAHRLHEIHMLLQRYARDSYSHTPNRADTIHSLPSALNELAELSPDPDASPHNGDNWRWCEAVRLVQTEAQRVIAASRNVSSATGSQADVVPLDRHRHTGKPGD